MQRSTSQQKTRTRLLALRMKPIIEARALARQQGGQGGILLSEKSHEATPAIRTDAAVASLANLGKDTIHLRIYEDTKPALPGLPV